MSKQDVNKGYNPNAKEATKMCHCRLIVDGSPEQGD